MSSQTDELKNVIASLQNVVKALEDAETPADPAVDPNATVTGAEDPSLPEEKQAEPAQAEPTTESGQIADNTPSANVTVS